MKRTKLAIVGLVLAVCLLSSALAVMYLERTVTHNIEVVGRLLIGLYQNDACTIPLTSIEWGQVERGCTTGKTFYIKNEGDKIAYVQWNVTTLPANVTLEVLWAGVVWSSGTEKNLTSNTIKNIDFNLRVGLDALMISSSFTQTFRAEDVM